MHRVCGWTKPESKESERAITRLAESSDSVVDACIDGLVNRFPI